MHLLLKIYFLLSTVVFANVVLENKEVNVQAFEVGYYIDHSKKMDFDEIKHQSFTVDKNKKSFRSNSTNLWIKVKVHNQSSHKQKLFLHHNNAYRLKQIKFYETQNNRVLNSFDINLSDPTESQKMYGTDAIYPFSLNVNESKTIYIEATSFIYQYTSLTLFDAQNSAQYFLSSHLAITLILSILLGLMLYHFILYLMTFFKEYLYYSLYLFFNILWGFYEYGLLSKYFNCYGEKYFILDLMIILSIIFLSFFVKNILQMSQFYPNENKLIYVIIFLHILNFSYILIDIYQTLFIFSIVATFSSLIYVYIIVSLYRKKDPYIAYILFAQIWFIVFNFITLFFYEGFIEYTFWTRYAYILGIFLDTFAFSYLLSYRIKLLQEESKRSQHKTKQIQALSKLLENISHQWRQPLTRINASVMHIAIEMKKNSMKNTKIAKKLNDIENLSVYLSQTIDDFKSLYRQDREMRKFNLHNAIEDSVALLGDEYEKHNIKISIQVSDDIYLNNYLNEFKQVVQVIFNNAKEALLEHQSTDPTILIVAIKEQEHVTLQISNNGGEIDSVIMHKIFDAHFTTKKQGEGIGLFMSQKIVTELMGGSLTCENIVGGVCFEMRF